MKCYRLAGHLASVTLLLVFSPCLWAQSASEVTVNGAVYYSGRQAGPVHIAAVDWNDIDVYDDGAGGSDLPLAAHMTITRPGPYSLTIPGALAGHSYAVLAQMDLDNSGLFSVASFQRYEPSGHQEDCNWWGDCNAPDAIPVDLLGGLDVDIYLSDYKPLCVLLDTFEADFLSDHAGGMDYYDGRLWIGQPHTGGRIDIRQVDPNTRTLVASHDLGIGHCTGLQWIGDDMWICFKGLTSWTIQQYTYDGQVFTPGASYALPSSVDWDTVWRVNIAYDGDLLWAQENGPCGHIYKLDLSDGTLVETLSACDFVFNKWLGLTDMSDICFSDGYLWAMNDGTATFSRIAPDPNQLPPDIHYTFAFDPNRHLLDYAGRDHDIDYRGMVKHGDLIYFVEEITNRDANDTAIGQRHRIHTAHLEQASQSDRDLILKLGGQYWFGSLSVDPDTNAPWAKRGSVSIAGNQWDQEWEDGNGHHTFSSAFSTTAQSDGSIHICFEDLPEETYNIAWNGDMMIHAGGALHGGGEAIDVFARKATDVAANDVLGMYKCFGHHLNSPWPGDSCGWGDFVFDSDGTAVGTLVNDGGATESIAVDWTFDDVNSVIEIAGPTINDIGRARLFPAKGGIAWAWQIVPEEGRDDLGYAILIEKTDELITMADIAGTYQVRFLETGPGGVPYTCAQGTCVIEAVDDVNGVLSMDAYFSDGWHDVSRKECSVGPGNELHIDDDDAEVGIIGPDKNLIFGPEYRYNNPPTREDCDWLGGIFLIRTPSSCQPVYRFWSPDHARHFYTISEDEKDYIAASYPPNIWTYETVAYRAFTERSDPSLAPVYRLWSDALSAHFYTIDQAERDSIMAMYPHVWAYEGPVFYAYPEGSQPVDASPVFRFWSEMLGTHFYTIDEDEKDFLIANYPHIWEYEAIAWYAYKP